MEGVDFADETKARLESYRRGQDSGRLCKSCRRRIPWKDLEFSYELDEQDRFVRLTTCGPCGTMLRQELLLERSDDAD